MSGTHHVSVMVLVPKPYVSNWDDQVLVCRCGWRAMAGPVGDELDRARSMVLEAHAEHARMEDETD